MELLLQRARFPCLVDHGHIVDFADNETFLRRKLAIFLFMKRCGLELCFCFPEIRVRTVVDIVVKEILRAHCRSCRDASWDWRPCQSRMHHATSYLASACAYRKIDSIDEASQVVCSTCMVCSKIKHMFDPMIVSIDRMLLWIVPVLQQIRQSGRTAQTSQSPIAPPNHVSPHVELSNELAVSNPPGYAISAGNLPGHERRYIETRRAASANRPGT